MYSTFLLFFLLFAIVFVFLVLNIVCQPTHSIHVKGGNRISFVLQIFLIILLHIELNESQQRNNEYNFPTFRGLGT